MVTVHFTINEFGFEKESSAVKARTKVADTPKFLPSLVEALPTLLLPVLILVGIRGGLFIPTKAAAAAVLDEEMAIDSEEYTYNILEAETGYKSDLEAGSSQNLENWTI